MVVNAGEEPQPVTEELAVSELPGERSGPSGSDRDVLQPLATSPDTMAAGEHLYTVTVVLIFMAVGPALMILNKEILDVVQFRYPILVSSLGLVASACFTHALKAAGMLRLQYESTIDFKFWATKCLPVGVCHAATLALGNAQYLFMGIASIQFLKAFTPIITACTTFALLRRKETNRSILALVALCISTSAVAGGDTNISLIGLGLSLGGSVAEAIRLVLTDFLLSGTKMQVLESMYYLAPAGGVCLFLLGAATEGPALMANGDLSKVASNPAMFAIAASLGVGVQLLTTTVIKVTSATGVKVLSQVRNTIPVFYGVVVYNETITANTLLCYFASLAAFAYYTFLKTLPKTDEPSCCENLLPGYQARGPDRENLQKVCCAGEAGGGGPGCARERFAGTKVSREGDL